MSRNGFIRSGAASKSIPSGDHHVLAREPVLAHRQEGSKMLTRFAKGTAFRCAMTVVLVVTAIGASAGPAAATSTSSPEITPATAARLLSPGYVKQGNDYLYEGGNVIVTPAYSTMSLPCPDAHVCLYRDTDWKGTRWIFKDHKWQNLRTYGASDEVSSWSNHKNRAAVLGWDSKEQGKKPYLDLPAHAHASSMGGWDNEASSVLP